MVPCHVMSLGKNWGVDGRGTVRNVGLDGKASFCGGVGHHRHAKYLRLPWTCLLDGNLWWKEVWGGLDALLLGASLGTNLGRDIGMGLFWGMWGDEVALLCFGFLSVS